MYIFILKYEYIYIFMSKEIVLSTEAMTFFLLNMFGHDPALHDFTPSTKMAKTRVSKSAGQMQALIDSKGHGGGKNIQKGGEPLEQASQLIVEQARDQTLKQGCIKDSIYLSEKDGKPEELLIIDWNIIHATRGVYTGYVYTWEKTYTPFDINLDEEESRRKSGEQGAPVYYFRDIDGSTIIIGQEDASIVVVGNGKTTQFKRLHNNATNKTEVLKDLFNP